MTTAARTSWLSFALRQLPASLRARLDRWSHEVARRRADRRRALLQSRQAAGR